MTGQIFKPFQWGQLNLKNRIIFPPITTGYANRQGEVTAELAEYYRRIAQGGVGAIIVEAAVVNPAGRLSRYSLGIWEDSLIEGLAKLADKIKSQGVAAFIQLAHAGPRAVVNAKEERPMSPSPVAFVKAVPPQQMTKEDIKRTVAEFVQAAWRAKKAGFDGVELHAAHFYLLSCFLSAATNTRNDEYGDNITGRTRILREIITGIREVAGADFPVICRFHGQEMGEKGIDAAEAKAIARQLADAGASGLHISAYYLPVPGLEKYFAIPGTPIPGEAEQPGLFAPLAAAVKGVVKIPVIAVGKINSVEVAEQLVAGAKCDLVAIGRPLVADPDFPKKMPAGETTAQCLYCCACINSLAAGKQMICRVNKDLPPKRQD